MFHRILDKRRVGRDTQLFHDIAGELAVLLVVILPIDHDNCAHAFEILEGAVAGDSWNSANEPYARRHKDPEAGLS